MGLESHCLGLTRKIRDLLGKKPGDFIGVVLQVDNEPRIVEVPEELQAQLHIHNLEAVFSKLSYTKRKEFVGSINGAKKTETGINGSGSNQQYEYCNEYKEANVQ